jgi:hypothetical protein
VEFSMRRKFFKTLMSAAGLVLAAVTVAAAAQAPVTQTLEGKLAFLMGTGPVLEANGKKVTLSARTTYLFHTLGDERLRNREVQLEGTKLPDGGFKVDEIRTIHNGRLYRVRYFCETCNIEALEPGPCVCCQQPVELQEIPLDKSDKNILVTK